MRQALAARQGSSLLKRRVLWLLIIGICLTALIVGIRPYLPREVDVRLEGVKYRLGAQHVSEIEPATIHIEGTVRQTLKGHRLFRGTVELNDELMPVPKEQMTNRRCIARHGEGFLLVYHWFDDGFIKSFTLGELYADDDFRQISLTLFEERKDSQSAWSSGDGLMLTAPAKDRTEAINLANKLMSYSLRGLNPMN